MLVRRRIQTPSAPGIGARFRGGGGRPRSSPSGPPSSATQRLDELLELPQAARWTEAFVAGGSHLAASSRSDSVGCRTRSRATSASRSGSRSSAPVRVSARIASSCRCAARLVRTRFAWSEFASRFASARAAATIARSSSASTASPAPAAARISSIAVQTLRVRDGVTPAVEDAEPSAGGGCRPSAGTPPLPARRCAARGAASAGPRASPPPSSAPRR